VRTEELKTMKNVLKDLEKYCSWMHGNDSRWRCKI